MECHRRCSRLIIPFRTLRGHFIRTVFLEFTLGTTVVLTLLTFHNMCGQIASDAGPSAGYGCVVIGAFGLLEFHFGALRTKIEVAHFATHTMGLNFTLDAFAVRCRPFSHMIVWTFLWDQRLFRATRTVREATLNTHPPV